MLRSHSRLKPEAAPSHRRRRLGLALLLPLAVQQMSYGHAEWIGNVSLGHRLWETAATFLTGETADIWGLKDRGRLQPGFSADMTVFDGDPLSATIDGLSALHVKLTIVDGRIVTRTR